MSAETTAGSRGRAGRAVTLAAQLKSIWRASVALVRSSDLAIAYASLVVLIAVVMAFLPAPTRDRIIQECSTNLANLRTRPLQVLVASGFVVSSLASLWQIPMLLLVYAAAQRWVGRVGAIVVAVIGHVGATLWVATMLSTGILHGWLSRSVARAADVGFSYGLAALAGFLISQVPPGRWRLLYIVLTVVYFAGPLLWNASFTAAGHATALALGLALALLAFRVTRAAAHAGRQGANR